MNREELIRILTERISTQDYTDDNAYVAEHHFLPALVSAVDKWLIEMGAINNNRMILSQEWRIEMEHR